MHRNILQFKCFRNMHRKILVLQPRGRKTHLLVGVKEFFEDEG